MSRLYGWKLGLSVYVIMYDADHIMNCILKTAVFLAWLVSSIFLFGVQLYIIFCFQFWCLQTDDKHLKDVSKHPEKWSAPDSLSQKWVMLNSVSSIVGSGNLGKVGQNLGKLGNFLVQGFQWFLKVPILICGPLKSLVLFFINNIL